MAFALALIFICFFIWDDSPLTMKKIRKTKPKPIQLLGFLHELHKNALSITKCH